MVVPVRRARPVPFSAAQIHAPRPPPVAVQDHADVVRHRGSVQLTQQPGRVQLVNEPWHAHAAQTTSNGAIPPIGEDSIRRTDDAAGLAATGGGAPGLRRRARAESDSEHNRAIRPRQTTA
jgi:hypothetical protein